MTGKLKLARSILAGLALLAATTLTVQSAAAQSLVDLYRDRTVTLLVHASPGGTYGQTAQLLRVRPETL